MEHALLVCKQVTREKFMQEAYTGEDDILALLESGSFVFDDGTGPQTVEPLEAVNFKRGKLYARHITAPASMYLFRYRSDASLFGSGKVIFRDRERVQSTLKLLHRSDSAFHLDVFACRQALFSDLVNQYLLENYGQFAEDPDSDPIIKAAIAVIHDDLHKKLNLAGMAEDYYLSYTQFARRFKRVTGTTPQDYLASARLDRSKKLLADTELSIAQIAKNCGFGSAYYFSSFFRARCRMSPSEYRALIRATGEA